MKIFKPVFNSNILVLIILFISNGCQIKEMNVMSIENGSINKWDSNSLEKKWSKNGLQFNSNQIEYNEHTYYQIEQSLLFKNSLSTFLNLEQGKSYIIDADIIINGKIDFEFGIWVLQEEKVIGYSYVNDNINEASTNIGTKFISGKGPVEVRIGYNNRGLGTVLIKELTAQVTDDIAIDFSNSNVNTLYKTLNLEPFDSLHYHANILLIVEYVNSLLISPLTTYYNYSGGDEEKRKFLNKEDSIKKIRAIEINASYPNSNFEKFMNMSVSEMSNSYCVKGSLSAYDILSAFHIPVNQIHFTNQEGVAVHQFFEYWHPYFQNWIIIDPFYGICYVDSKGKWLGFDELKSYAAQEKIDSTFVSFVNIQPFYFNLEELSTGWNNHMFHGSHSFDQMSIVY